jgi:hypothetical protein
MTSKRTLFVLCAAVILVGGCIVALFIYGIKNFALDRSELNKVDKVVASLHHTAWDIHSLADVYAETGGDFRLNKSLPEFESDLKGLYAIYGKPLETHQFHSPVVNRIDEKTVFEWRFRTKCERGVIFEYFGFARYGQQFLLDKYRFEPWDFGEKRL